MFAQMLRDIERAHRNDKDSGDSIVEEIRRLLRALPQGESEQLERELARLAADGTDEMAGVAIEVFAREGASKADVLYRAFGAAKSASWRDQVALALVRTRPRHLAGPLAEHIAGALADPQMSGGPVELAYLYSIDPHAFYELAVPYLVSRLAAEGGAGLRGLLPVYLSELSSTGAAPLNGLLDRLCGADPSAARRFAAMVREYLREPWAADSLDGERADSLRASLRDWHCP